MRLFRKKGPVPWQETWESETANGSRIINVTPWEGKLAVTLVKGATACVMMMDAQSGSFPGNPAYSLIPKRPWWRRAFLG